MRGEDVMQRVNQLASERALLEDMWQRIAEVMFPLRADFIAVGDRVRNRTSEQYDTTAQDAADKLAAGIWGWANNSATKWFGLDPLDDQLAADRDARLWLDHAEAELRGMFRARGDLFYSRIHDAYRDLVTFGTGILYLEPDDDVGLYTACYSVANCYIDTNERDQVDTVFRKFQLSGRNMLRKFPELPASIRKQAEDKPADLFSVVHGVFPREDWDRRAKRNAIGKRKRYASTYVHCDTGEVLGESGYDTSPYAVARWSTLTGLPYGESPGMLALSDARMLRVIGQATIVAVERLVDPPTLTTDDGIFRPGERIAPGTMIPGGIDEQGRPQYRFMEYGADPRAAQQIAEPYRNQVRRTFLADLLQMVQQDRMTATEVLERRQETLRLIGPQLARIQSEMLDPVIDRAFDIAAQQKRFLPVPMSLAEAPQLRVKYEGPAARAQQLGDAQATMQGLQAIASLAQMKPEVLDVVDGDEAGRILARAYGMPASALRATDVVQAERQARAQAQQQAAEAEQEVQRNAAVKDATAAISQGADAMATMRQVATAGGSGEVVQFPGGA